MKTKYTSEVFDRNVSEYEAWYEDNPGIYASELAAIREHFGRMPATLRGIEVGLGTGRFAAPLGIREGVEPSSGMARKAVERGIEVMDALAENLPYADLQFDFVLYVTICHLQSLKHAFLEANRVLKKNGVIIIGFLPSDRPVAQAYMDRRRFSTFYRDAVFYTVGHIEKLLEETGFKSLEFNQVLFGGPDTPGEEQVPRPGHGEGSFVVVSALKA